MGTTITVTQGDDGGAVYVRVGDTIEVHLPENAAGGYRWLLDDDDDGPLHCTRTGSNYPSDAVGSTGEAVFIVAVRAAGTARLGLTYARPWEGDAGVAKHFSVAVHATG